MTSDSLHHPTESLVLPNKRRFFPLKIPNFHTQLRHYISTADPDRIYVVVERIVYAIHIAAKKREIIAVIPFEPRCLAAGFGWIAVGGPENGECAYIRIDERGLQVQGDGSVPRPADVDSALPLDLETPWNLLSPGTSSGGTTPGRRSASRPFPGLALHKFGGSIVNSVTIHRLPGDGDSISYEDVLVLSNNDRSVTIHSLTREKTLKVLQHASCMNYATISPDHTLLAAVGDEHRAYFYEIIRDWGSVVTTEHGKKLTGWRELMMHAALRLPFSPSSHLCAIGSQSGIITILDVEIIHHNAVTSTENGSPVLSQFPASRSCSEGGAVRCMTFSPEPWDLLVWLEGHGRAGVADVRQKFVRRQTLHLDLGDPQLHEVHTDTIGYDVESSSLDDDGLHIATRLGLDADDNGNERTEAERSALRENLTQDLTERERAIMDFLNTTRWSNREERHARQSGSRTTLHPPPAPRTRHHASTDDGGRSSRPTSPPHFYDPSDIARDGHLGRTDRTLHPRRQSSVVLSQGSRSSEAGTSTNERQASVTLSLAASPSEIQSTGSDVAPRDTDQVHHDMENARPPDALGPFPALSLGVSSEALTRLRNQRSSSTPRRTERPQAERRYDTSRLSNYEIRANVAAERIRRQRNIANELHSRHLDQEQRYRQQVLSRDHNSPGWISNIISGLPDRSLIHGPGAEEPDATAGVGWGADGRTLYVATLEGIFEFQVNLHDRKTFPIFSYR
ncbi:hypothetical protein N7512_000892 [Penicillium capsulatum]|nr:hypothetical protein N7512_000892 [Penicillium capsulatum]